MDHTKLERVELATACEIAEQYLYQVLTGRREASPELCVRIESESNRRIRRWQLRPSDWNRIWPELIGSEGAPDVAAQAMVEAAK